MVLDLKVFVQSDQVSSGKKKKKRQNILPFIKTYFKEIMYIMAYGNLTTFLKNKKLHSYNVDVMETYRGETLIKINSCYYESKRQPAKVRAK